MANPAPNFDGLTYANALREAGVPEKQANLQARALLSIVQDQLLTKQDLEKVELKLANDIERLEAKLGSDIKEVELRLKADIKDSELRLVFRLTGIITFIMTLVTALFKFLPTVHL